MMDHSAIPIGDTLDHVLVCLLVSNRIHPMLRARPDVVESWSDQDVVRRVVTIDRLIKGKTGTLSRPLLENEVTNATADKERVALLRARLCDILYLMKALSEYIGRRANREDNCTGLLPRNDPRPLFFGPSLTLTARPNRQRGRRGCQTDDYARDTTQAVSGKWCV